MVLMSIDALLAGGMTPPYKFIDEATGETVWSGMDTDARPVHRGLCRAGREQRRWPASRNGALERPGFEPEPPDPSRPSTRPIDPTPHRQEPAWTIRRTSSELRDCLTKLRPAQLCRPARPAHQRRGHAARSCIQVPSSGTPWGVDGHYAKINYRGAAAMCFVSRALPGVNNRGLTVKNLVLDGGDGGNMSGGGASACLRLSAPLGDNGPIYKFHLENIYTIGRGRRPGSRRRGLRGRVQEHPRGELHWRRDRPAPHGADARGKSARGAATSC